MLKRKNTDETDILRAFTPAFRVDRPENWQGGVVFASPHSGNVYPKGFLRRSRLSLTDLRRNEDVFIDTLFAPAVHCGAPLLSALFPRCFVDVNRAADELPASHLPDGHKTTPRAEMGLGVSPSIISQDRPIYNSPPGAHAVRARLEKLYHPYHAALTGLLENAQANCGSALLIDCHSMPGFSATGDRRPDIILGDRYGVSCHPETLKRVEAIFQVHGFHVARNHPYAGGYVTSHYGRPEMGVEALQIEINRDLYLNPVTLKPNRGLETLKRQLAVIIEEIISGFYQEIALAAQ